VKLTARPAQRLVALLARDWIDQEDQLAYCGRGCVVPELGTVYILCNQRNEPLYVGHSSRLRLRLAQHEANPRIAATAWDGTFFFIPGQEQLHKRLLAETILIAALCPPLNRGIQLQRGKGGRWYERPCWSRRKR
jgi:hypothetical protein